MHMFVGSIEVERIMYSNTYTTLPGTPDVHMSAKQTQLAPMQGSTGAKANLALLSTCLVEKLDGAQVFF